MSDENATMTVGQRIKFHRERAGKTRPVLGGLVGKSAEWVKAVETGRILPLIGSQRPGAPDMVRPITGRSLVGCCQS